MTDAGADRSGELSPGMIVGRYVIQSALGRGGMGIVYEAHDPELDRRVALKVLPAAADGSPLAQARLRREAQALAKLSHPNVVAVHDVGAFGDRIFLAMERIDGITLSEWLAERRRSWKEILAVFRQAGEGLAAAHAAGLIHRDFKPDNVLVDRHGRAKVLDFGLARAPDQLGEEAGRLALSARDVTLANAETLEVASEKAAPVSATAPTAASAPADEATAVSGDGRASSRGMKGPGDSARADKNTPSTLLQSPLTATGTLLGTPLYMSPEQHLRSPTDERTDQFSFAVALHEALYGQRPFRGETLYHLRQTVTKGEVAPPPKGSAVPERLRRAILRALKPSPADRFPSMEALLAELPVDERGLSRRALLARGATAVGLAAATIAALRVLRQRPAAAPVKYQRLTFHGASTPRLAPDGRHIVYNSERKLVVLDLAGGAENVIHDAGLYTHWISNSEVAIRETAGDMVAISIEDGSSRVIPPEAARSPDGSRIVVCNEASKEITVVDSRSGAKTAVPVGGDFTWLSSVSWSPRADLLLLTTWHEGASTLSTLSLDGSPRRPLVQEVDIGEACFSPRGDAFYYIRGGLRSSGGDELVKVPIEPRSGASRGAAEVVLTGLNAGSHIAVSPDGQRLFFQRGASIGHIWTVELPGAPGQRPRVERITTTARCRHALAISPDGKQALVAELDTGVTLTAIALDSGAARQIANLDGVLDVVGLAWSPDGTEIALTAEERRDGRFLLHRVPVGGGPRSTADLLVSDDLAWAPSPHILVQADDNRNFHVMDPASFRVRPLLRETDGWPFQPTISPDGKKVAFFWNRKSDAGDGLWLVSIEDGSARFLLKGMFTLIGFSPDGESVYVLEGPSYKQLIAVSIATAAVTVLAELPFPEGVTWIRIIPGTNRLVCLVSEGGPDLWVAEGFDPEAAAR